MALASPTDSSLIPAASSLRAGVPRAVHEGFGRSLRASALTARPGSVEELRTWLARARREGLKVTFRGAGRSYGDAALGEGLLLDLTGMNRVLDWNPRTGVIDAEAGVTIEGVWRRTLEDGFWPHVVPGTMFPTLGGCVGMNIHGKNHFKAGAFGDHVEELDLVTADGALHTLQPERDAATFRGVVSGMGLLGAVTRVKLRLHQVGSGLLDVQPLSAPSLEATFDLFEEWLPRSDYLVGWLDCIAPGKALGRSELHSANYVPLEAIEGGQRTRHIETQGLPDRIFGWPKRWIWPFLRPWLNRRGMRLVNAVKYWKAAVSRPDRYLQSHVAFAFLLDYVPDWRLAYGPGGLIQVQVFVPHATARQTFRQVIETTQQAGMPSILAVMKRHRADTYLLSHALDGWSLAMDFKVTAGNRERMWAMAQRIHEQVAAAGGRLYFAKDSAMRPSDAQSLFGAERLAAFSALKQQLDPEGLFETQLARRVGLLPPSST